MTDSIRYDEQLIKRLFYSLMPAAIVIMLSGSVNSIVDGIVASNFIGNNAIAAIGYYTPFISILIGISTIFSGGCLIITGNRLGKGDEEGASRVLSTDLILLGAILLLINILMFCGSELASKILGAEQALVKDTSLYIRGISFSYLPLYLGSQINQYLELEQKHIRNYIAIGVMVVINIATDLVFVCVFDLGCFGLGLATTISSFCNFVILIQYYFTSKSQLKFRLSYLDISLLPQIFTIGVPGALIQIYLAVRGYIYNKSIIHYAGADGMAAFAAVNSFASVFYAFTNGIGVSSRTLFSIFSGAQDRESIKTTIKIALYRAFPINVVISVFFILLSRVFTRIYFEPSSEVFNIALQLFRICPLAVSFATIGVVFSALYQCQEQMKVVNVLSIVDGLLGVCLSLVILCPFLGITGVWLAWFTNNIFVALVVLVYVCISLKRRPKSLNDWLLFKNDFGTEDDQRLNFSVHDESDVVTCSKRIIDFLAGREVDEKHRFYVGLALEEMAGNAISHGYKKDNKKHSVVIECVDAEDKLVLHIMDDCKAFDPLSKNLTFDPNDPAKNIGIRMVQKLSKNIKYYRMVGLNILTIEI